MGKWASILGKMNKNVLKFYDGYYDNWRLSGSLGPTRFLMNFIPKDKKPLEVISYLQKRNSTALSILESHLSMHNWNAYQFSAADLSCCSYLFAQKTLVLIENLILISIAGYQTLKHSKIGSTLRFIERVYPPK